MLSNLTVKNTFLDVVQNEDLSTGASLRRQLSAPATYHLIVDTDSKDKDQVEVKPDDCATRMQETKWQKKTVSTVMMRHLPNRYTQKMLLEELDQAGVSGFDFFYLPVDVKTGANLGYAFLNFPDPAHADAFKDKFEGQRMKRSRSTKVLAVVPAALQGFEANYAKYSHLAGHGNPCNWPLFRDQICAQQNFDPADNHGKCRNTKSKEEAAEPFQPLTLQLHQHLPMMYSRQPESRAEQLQSSEMPRPNVDMHLIQIPVTMSFCPHCGRRVAQQHRYCGFCGGCVVVAANNGELLGTTPWSQ